MTAHALVRLGVTLGLVLAAWAPPAAAQDHGWHGYIAITASYSYVGEYGAGHGHTQTIWKFTGGGTVVDNGDDIFWDQTGRWQETSSWASSNFQQCDGTVTLNASGQGSGTGAGPVRIAIRADLDDPFDPPAEALLTSLQASAGTYVMDGTEQTCDGSGSISGETPPCSPFVGWNGHIDPALWEPAPLGLASTTLSGTRSDGISCGPGQGRLIYYLTRNPVQCSDGRDNDDDGYTDYAGGLSDLRDPGCENNLDDAESTKCSNGGDDDGDGEIDYKADGSGDPGCSDGSDESELSQTMQCDDGDDDDGDGKIDYKVDGSGDPGCTGPDDNDESHNLHKCDDGADNDHDGTIDRGDAGCTSDDDDDELADHLVCDNGRDEDSDGRADFKVNGTGDADCTGPTDNDERSPTFTWSMPERYNGTDRNGDGLADYFTPLNFEPFPPAPDDHPISPARWRVDVSATPCKAGYTWYADGAPVSSGCAPYLLLSEGPHTVSLVVGGRTVDTQTVTVKDWLIAAIGDSYGSGEGNPDVTKVARAGPDIPSKWQDRPCHRSAYASAALAARDVERADEHSSVTLLHLSCSGATIPVGLLGSYKGAAPDASVVPMPPQVQELSSLLLGRRPDALLISIGGNDIGFADIMKICLVFPACNIGTKKCVNLDGAVKRVLRSLVVPVLPTPRGARWCFSSAKRLFEKNIGAGGRKLAAKYNRLASRLAPIGAKHVIVTGYPDVTRGDNGRYCGTAGNSTVLGDALPQVLDQIHSPRKVRRKVAALRRKGYLRIDGAETRWAYETVLVRLNNALRKIAADHGWTYIGAHVGAAARHGYCAQLNWVRTWTEAKLLQEAIDLPITFGGALQSPGVAHPDKAGHVNYANAILPALRRFGMPTG
jgi:hypothetical protein